MKIIYGSPLSGKTKELIKEANKCDPKEILFFTTETPEEVLKIERVLNLGVKVIVINAIECCSIEKLIRQHEFVFDVKIKQIFVDQFLSVNFYPAQLNKINWKLHEVIRLEYYHNIKVTFTCYPTDDLLACFKKDTTEVIFVNLDNNKKLEEESVENKIKKLELQKQEIDSEIHRLTLENYINHIREKQFYILKALIDFQAKYDTEELHRDWDSKTNHYYISYNPITNDYRIFHQ